jgi:cellulose synthase/poly-beta-1,6-N-acetylglucosamine synthase-like glycosyltransferase
VIRSMFWAATAGLVYSYAVFPALVLLRGAIRRRPHIEKDVTPSVTVVIAAYNEAGRIERKLRSVLAQDYAGRLTIIVASDGSDDGTVAIVAGLDQPDVRVLDLPRSGKAAAIGAAVAEADGDILVLSDANSIFAPESIRLLVRPFADPEVGGVAGNQVYVRGDDVDAIAVGERSYWDFDRAMKLAQSRAGNVIAGTGALYAIRRDLFRPIPPGVNDDFFLSLAVIDSGYRLVFQPGAVAYEPVSPSATVEYSRRVRIMTRGLRCVAAVPRVLDPRRTGFYALQVFSHKVLMRVMAVPLAVVALTSLRLYPRGLVYRIAAWAQLAFYGLAAAGVGLGRRGVGHHPLLALPAYFCMVQAASLHATWNLLRGRSYDRWRTARDGPHAGRDDVVDEGPAAASEGPSGSDTIDDAASSAANAA